MLVQNRDDGVYVTGEMRERERKRERERERERESELGEKLWAFISMESTKISEVNLSAFIYRLFHEDFSLTLTLPGRLLA